MKNNEIDDGPNTISYNSLDNEEGYSKTTESNEQTISHEILSKPKTMKNNCVNLKCMDNVQKLWAVKEQYKQLEKKYFEMESSGSKRCEEFEELLHKKENDLNLLKQQKNIYIEQNINNLDYYKLKNLEAKILHSLDYIQQEKQKLFLQSTKGGLYSKKTCIACYENEIKIVFKPCYHLCVCEKCSPKSEICPLCREPIRERERIKYSYNY